MNLEYAGKILFEVLAVGGSASAIAYGFFKWFGQKWLETKFSERLEKLKHEQERELERHKFQINSLFSRVSKIHEKEFDVLPTAWYKLQDTLRSVSHFTSPLQFYPDLKSMTQPAFDSFLEQSPISAEEKQRLIHSFDKQATYQEIIFWYDIRDVRGVIGEFHNYLLKNRIFLSKELFDKFGALDTMLTDAVSERQIGHVSKDFTRKADSYKIFRDELFNLIGEVEKLVQERLHFEDAA